MKINSELKKESRELSYQNLANVQSYDFESIEKSYLPLLVNFSKNSRFQNRLCEKGFLTRIIVPLLGSNMKDQSMKQGCQILRNLSENNQTHQKLNKAMIYFPISGLILKNINWQIFLECIEILNNMASNPVNLSHILNLKIFEFLIKELQNSYYKCQEAVLRLLLSLTNQDFTLPPFKLIKIWIDNRNINELISCLLSKHERIFQLSIRILKLLTINAIHQLDLTQLQSISICLFQRLSADKLESYILQQTLSLFQELTIQKRLITPSFSKQFLKLIRDILKEESPSLEIDLRIVRCLASFSRHYSTHDLLLNEGLINFIYDKLHTKDLQLRRQSVRFMNNIFFNPNFFGMLMSSGMAQNLAKLISNSDQTIREQSMLAISSLSCFKDFYLKLNENNILGIIQILQNETTNIQILRAAGNTLANISVDFGYHDLFLKDPEKSILIRILLRSKDQRLLKYIIILFTNISMNNKMFPLLAQEQIIDIFYDFFRKQDPQTIGYVSKAIASLSVNKQFRGRLISERFVPSLLMIVFCTESQHTKRMISLALLVVVTYSDQVHQQFFSTRGIETVMYFLQSEDVNLAYLASKFFVVLAKNQKNLFILENQELCCRFSKLSVSRTGLILTQSIRFFITLIIHRNKNSKWKAQELIKLVNIALKLKGPQQLESSIYAIMLMTQSDQLLDVILENQKALQLLSFKNQQILKVNWSPIVRIIINLSLSDKSVDLLLKYQLLELIERLIRRVNMDDMIYYSLVVLAQMIRVRGQFLNPGSIIRILQIGIKNDQISIQMKCIEIIYLMIPLMEDNNIDILFFSIEDVTKTQNNQLDPDSLQMLIQILAEFSRHPASLPFFSKAQFIGILLKELDSEKPAISSICTLLTNLAEFISSNQQTVKSVLKVIEKLNSHWESQKDSILGFLTMYSQCRNFSTWWLPLSAFKNLMVLLLDKLQENQCTLQLKLVIKAFINFTKCNYGILSHLSKFKLGKPLVKFIIGQDHIISPMAASLLNNLVVQKNFLRRQKDNIIRVLKHLEQSKGPGKLLFLRIFFNVLVTDFTIYQQNKVLREMIRHIFFIMQEENDDQILGTAIDVVNFIIKSEEGFTDVFYQERLLERIALQFNIATQRQKDNILPKKLVSSIMLFVSNISTKPSLFSTFCQQLNLDSFMQNYAGILSDYYDTQSKIYVLLLLINILSLKSKKNSLLKCRKSFIYLLRLFNTSDSNILVQRQLIKIFSSISDALELHSKIASPQILKGLIRIFNDRVSSIQIKFRIKIILSNLTFSRDVHTLLIQLGALKVLQKIIRDQTRQNQYKKILNSALINLSLNKDNYSLVEGQINMLNSLTVIWEVNVTDQLKLLQAASAYVVQEQRFSRLQSKVYVLENILMVVKKLLAMNKFQIQVGLRSILLQISRKKHYFCYISTSWGQLLKLISEVVQHNNLLQVKNDYLLTLSNLVQEERVSRSYRSSDQIKIYFLLVLKVLVKFQKFLNSSDQKEIYNYQIQYQANILIFLKYYTVCLDSHDQEAAISLSKKRIFKDFLLRLVQFQKHRCLQILLKTISLLGRMYKNHMSENFSVDYQVCVNFIFKNYMKRGVQQDPRNCIEVEKLMIYYMKFHQFKFQKLLTYKDSHGLMKDNIKRTCSIIRKKLLFNIRQAQIQKNFFFLLNELVDIDSNIPFLHQQKVIEAFMEFLSQPQNSLEPYYYLVLQSFLNLYDSDVWTDKFSFKRLERCLNIITQNNYLRSELLTVTLSVILKNCKSEIPAQQLDSLLLNVELDVKDHEKIGGLVNLFRVLMEKQKIGHFLTIQPSSINFFYETLIRHQTRYGYYEQLSLILLNLLLDVNIKSMFINEGLEKFSLKTCEYISTIKQTEFDTYQIVNAEVFVINTMLVCSSHILSQDQSFKTRFNYKVVLARLEVLLSVYELYLFEDIMKNLANILLLLDQFVEDDSRHQFFALLPLFKDCLHNQQHIQDNSLVEMQRKKITTKNRFQTKKTEMQLVQREVPVLHGSETTVQIVLGSTLIILNRWFVKGHFAVISKEFLKQLIQVVVFGQSKGAVIFQELIELLFSINLDQYFSDDQNFLVNFLINIIVRNYLQRINQINFLKFIKYISLTECSKRLSESQEFCVFVGKFFQKSSSLQELPDQIVINYLEAFFILSNLNQVHFLSSEKPWIMDLFKLILQPKKERLPQIEQLVLLIFQINSRRFEYFQTLIEFEVVQFLFKVVLSHKQLQNRVMAISILANLVQLIADDISLIRFFQYLEIHVEVVNESYMNYQQQGKKLQFHFDSGFCFFVRIFQIIREKSLAVVSQLILLIPKFMLHKPLKTNESFYHLVFLGTNLVNQHYMASLARLLLLLCKGQIGQQSPVSNYLFFKMIQVIPIQFRLIKNNNLRIDDKLIETLLQTRIADQPDYSCLQNQFFWEYFEIQLNKTQLIFIGMLFAFHILWSKFRSKTDRDHLGSRFLVEKLLKLPFEETTGMKSSDQSFVRWITKLMNQIELKKLKELTGSFQLRFNQLLTVLKNSKVKQFSIFAFRLQRQKG